MSDLHDTPPSGGRGRAAILGVRVAGPEGATVCVAVEHRSPGDVWSPAGSFSAIAPGDSALRIPALREEMRFRITGDEAQVRVLPPEWLPC